MARTPFCSRPPGRFTLSKKILFVLETLTNGEFQQTTIRSSEIAYEERTECRISHVLLVQYGLVDLPTASEYSPVRWPTDNFNFGSVSTMETLMEVSETNEATRAFIFAQGYMRALADAESTLSEVQRRQWSEIVKQAVATAQKVAPEVRSIVSKAQEAGEKEVRAFLARTVDVAVATRSIGEIRQELLRRHPDAIDFWSDEAQAQIDHLRDTFEEAVETIALGLNADFQKAIAAARAEAGLISGKRSKPTA
jgi:hypothetical protein